MCFSSSFGSTSAGRFCRNGHLATPHPAGKPSPPTCLGGKGQRDPTSTPRLQMFPVGWRWREGATSGRPVRRVCSSVHRLMVEGERAQAFLGQSRGSCTAFVPAAPSAVRQSTAATRSPPRGPEGQQLVSGSRMGSILLGWGDHHPEGTHTPGLWTDTRCVQQSPEEESGSSDEAVRMAAGRTPPLLGVAWLYLFSPCCPGPSRASGVSHDAPHSSPEPPSHMESLPRSQPHRPRLGGAQPPQKSFLWLLLGPLSPASTTAFPSSLHEPLVYTACHSPAPRCTSDLPSINSVCSRSHWRLRSRDAQGPPPKLPSHSGRSTLPDSSISSGCSPSLKASGFRAGNLCSDPSLSSSSDSTRRLPRASFA